MGYILVYKDIEIVQVV